ncbi:hypothetical protein B0H14DRAFT_2765333, partial [Mycena olivaceomarginata]
MLAAFVWVKEFMSKLLDAGDTRAVTPERTRVVCRRREMAMDRGCVIARTRGRLPRTLQPRPTVAQLCGCITAFRPARARDWCAAATSASAVQHDGTLAPTRPRAVVVVQHDGNCAVAAYRFPGCQSASTCARGSRSCARPPVSCSRRSARRRAALPTRNRPAVAGTRARQPGFSRAHSSYHLREAHVGRPTFPPSPSPRSARRRAASPAHHRRPPSHCRGGDTCMQGTWISPCTLEAA